MGSFPSGFLYLSFGSNIVLSPRFDLVLELALTSRGDWYRCGVRSSGGWGAAGLAIRPWGSRAFSGFFVQPKVRWRIFDSAPGTTGGGWFSCDGTHLGGWDGELGLGLDLGYQLVYGAFFVATMIGVNAGACINCPGGEFFDWEIFGASEPRETGFTFGLNVNLFRLGIAF